MPFRWVLELPELLRILHLILLIENVLLVRSWCDLWCLRILIRILLLHPPLELWRIRFVQLLLPHIRLLWYFCVVRCFVMLVINLSRISRWLCMISLRFLWCWSMISLLLLLMAMRVSTSSEDLAAFWFFVSILRDLYMRYWVLCL